MNLTIHTDGGSRGNPGPGAVGVVIESRIKNQESRIIAEFGKRVGIVTNNEAEYLAVIEALKEVKKIKDQIANIQFILDSKLIREQVMGNWKIKQDHLKELFNQVKALEKDLGVPISYTHVLRDKNKHADKLLNEALG